MKKSIRLVSCVGIAFVFAVLAAGCNENFSIKDVSPASGVLAGNEPIKIIGSGFDKDMGVSVYFGNAKAPNVVVTGTGEMTVTSPSADEEGVVNVRVALDNGTEYLIENAFRYIPKSGMDIRDLGQRKSLREEPKE